MFLLKIHHVFNRHTHNPHPSCHFYIYLWELCGLEICKILGWILIYTKINRLETDWVGTELLSVYIMYQHITCVLVLYPISYEPHNSQSNPNQPISNPSIPIWINFNPNRFPNNLSPPNLFPTAQFPPNLIVTFTLVSFVWE